MTSKLTWGPTATFGDISLPLYGCMHFPLTSETADKLVDRLLTTTIQQ